MTRKLKQQNARDAQNPLVQFNRALFAEVTEQVLRTTRDSIAIVLQRYAPNCDCSVYRLPTAQFVRFLKLAVCEVLFLTIDTTPID
jgi:hypothetical protein